MMVTDVTFVRTVDGEDVWRVWTVPVEWYRPGMSEGEAAAVAVRMAPNASAPGARGVEGPATLSANEVFGWRPCR